MTSFVGAALMGLSNASASNRAIILAALAIVSATLSNFAPTLWAPPLVFVNTPLLPGIYFGMVLGLAIWFWVSRSALKILTVIIAWAAAKITAEHAFEAIQHMLEEIAAPGKTPTINFVLAVSGVLGGLVGSTILTFGLSLVCKEFGAFEN